MRFGCLFVYDKFFNEASPYGKVQCYCDCGNVKFVKKGNLISRIRSCGECGLYQKQYKTTNYNYLYKTGIYNTWDAMKQRCTNENNTSWANYGGRGIFVCEKWLSFDGFCEDMLKSYSEGLEIDRIDVNKGYFKENCRWVNKSLQAFNKRITEKNSSGFVGVSYSKVMNKWEAYINKFNKKINLGYYSDISDAIEARRLGEIKYFGEELNKCKN